MNALKHWPRSSLGGLLNIRYGKALTADLRRVNGKYAVLGSAGEMARTDSALCQDEFVVIGRKGNVGQVQLVRTGGWPIDTTYFAAIPPLFEPKFLFYQLISLKLSRLDSSTATPSLRRQDLERQLLVHPHVRSSGGSSTSSKTTSLASMPQMIYSSVRVGRQMRLPL